MAAKRHLGQHFLKDTGVLERLVRLIQPSGDDLIIEVGAGRGSLSERLAPRVGHLIAVEIDRDCIVPLEAVLEAHPNVTIVHGDILELDLKALAETYLKSKQRLRVVGNLPYNLGTAIIERLLQLRLPTEEMVFLLQREVAERITASPGSHPYGFFTVFCHHYCEPQMGFRIGPACFVPRPKVTSAVVTLMPRQKRWDPDHEQSFEELVKAAFAHRRKTLTNSLRYHAGIRALADEILREASIDGSVRPERLTVSEYERLACVYHRLRTPKSGA
jgi:16S rRNA (adenine1518-N6/adenine1519-N6)-dimethyltransferase